MKVLIAYASKHGATRSIVQRLCETIEHAGAAVAVLDVAQRTELPPFDAAVVGSAVYMGRWMKEAADFVRGNRAA